MLKIQQDRPSTHAARLVQTFLREPDWIPRRSENISFSNDESYRRSTKIDVALEKYPHPLAEPLFKNPTVPLVPVSVVRKDLKLVGTLQDGSGRQLPVATRDVNTFFAWSFLCELASEKLGCSLNELSTDIKAKIKEICWNFPSGDEAESTKNLVEWEPVNSWSPQTKNEWSHLTDDDEFSRVLRTFTFVYLLMAEIADHGTAEIVIFEHTEPIKFPPDKWVVRLASSFGWKPTEFPILTPSVGWGRSYHLEITVPEDLIITDAILTREIIVDRQILDFFEIRRSANSVSIHTTDSMPVGLYSLVIQVDLKIQGLFRALFTSVLIASALLIACDFLIHPLWIATRHKSESAITILLVVPTLITTYLIRPGEHALTSRMLLSLRICGGLVALVDYMAAGLTILTQNNQQQLFNRLWGFFSVSALALAIVISAAVFLSRSRTNLAKKLYGSTQSRQVEEFESAGYLNKLFE